MTREEQKINYWEELKEDIEIVICERVDRGSNEIKTNKKYDEYKNEEYKLLEEIKKELSAKQKEKLIKILDLNYKKESLLEKSLYV